MSEQYKFVQSVNIDGTLVVSDLVAISGNTQLVSDTNGKISKHSYAPIIGGQIPLNTEDVTYTITDANIVSTSNPVCSVVAPISGSTIYSHTVYNVTNGSFKVELSEIPAISGYNLNWMSLQYN